MGGVRFVVEGVEECGGGVRFVVEGVEECGGTVKCVVVVKVCGTGVQGTGGRGKVCGE